MQKDGSNPGQECKKIIAKKTGKHEYGGDQGQASSKMQQPRVGMLEDAATQGRHAGR